jgi:DNA-binding IclR family transcriptional regulator
MNPYFSFTPSMEQRSDSALDSASQLDRALDILELLARSGSPQGLTGIAEQAGVPKATVHRLLATLQARGYVTQDARTGGYGAGIRCFELGSLWAQHLDLRAIAAPSAAVLNERSGETVHLAIYDHGDVIYIDKIESRHPVVATSHVGRRCPATCVATGRALLAFQPREEIEGVLRGPLPAYSEHSITRPAELAALLSQVRRDGYAVNHGSYRETVGGVAAPIRDHTGSVIASIGLCMPEQRFGAERFGSLVGWTVEAAVAVSAALGGPSVLVTSAPPAAAPSPGVAARRAPAER